MAAFFQDLLQSSKRSLKPLLLLEIIAY